MGNNPTNAIDPSGRFAWVLIPIAIGIGVGIRAGSGYYMTRYGGADAVTVLPYLPWVIKSPNMASSSAVDNAVVDLHEKVHQGSLSEYFSEKNAYLQTIIVARDFMNNGYNGRPLTDQERAELQQRIDTAIWMLGDMGVDIDPNNLNLPVNINTPGIFYDPEDDPSDDCDDSQWA